LVLRHFCGASLGCGKAVAVPNIVFRQLASIPEEEIWLSKQKSARPRRAYRLDVQDFMRTLGITSPEELRQADHKAVINLQGG